MGPSHSCSSKCGITPVSQRLQGSFWQFLTLLRLAHATCSGHPFDKLLPCANVKQVTCHIRLVHAVDMTYLKVLLVQGNRGALEAIGRYP